MRIKKPAVGNSLADESFSKMKNSTGARKKPNCCKFKCPDPRCIYTTSHKSNLRRHILAMHSSIKAFKECCDRYFFSKVHYNMHLKVDHLNGFKCKQCEKLFKRRSILLRHIDAMHGTLPHAHQCHHCSYSTSHKSNLKRHCKLKHKEEMAAKLSAHTTTSVIWRPVPEIFLTSNEDVEPEKEVMERHPTLLKVLTPSSNVLRELICPVESSREVLKTACHKSITSVSSMPEYLHKKLRWNVR